MNRVAESLRNEFDARGMDGGEDYGTRHGRQADLLHRLLLVAGWSASSCGAIAGPLALAAGPRTDELTTTPAAEARGRLRDADRRRGGPQARYAAETRDHEATTETSDCERGVSRDDLVTVRSSLAHAARPDALPLRAR